MVDFAKADLCTKPSPVKVSIEPTVVGSTHIQMQLGTIPDLTLSYKANGSGWEKFNADVLKHAATTAGDALLSFGKSTIQSKAQDFLNDKASFDVPPIPISVDGVSVTVMPSDIKISTNDDHIMITATVAVF
jgi:hypothetical protein